METLPEEFQQYLDNVAQNVAALSRSEANAQQQIAKGEYALYVMTPGAPTTIVGLPKPWPFRLIVPDDGQMVLLLGLSYLQQAPHPNAAKVFANWIASKEGTSIYGGIDGSAAVRTDLDSSTWLEADLVPKPGGDYFDVYDFKYVTQQRQPIARFYAGLKT